MGTCAECGDAVGTTYDCRDCGEAFCVDCRLPDDHVCTTGDRAATGATDGGATDGGGTTVPSSVSFPTPPRITALLPIWRAIPWQLHALLAIILVPISPVLLAWHVYHERVADAIAAETRVAGDHGSDDASADDEWTPSWVYYFPAVLFGIAAAVGNVQLVAVLGGLPGVVGAVIYVVQKRRHGAALLSL